MPMGPTIYNTYYQIPTTTPFAPDTYSYFYIKEILVATGLLIIAAILYKTISEKYRESKKKRI
ncbi:MAG: hypothetical protein INQ03_10265 [Candidatus Heimdallarchaeota archaeon]|nr:hypothetical protein [Candidatus Heimdallarchaeota archaeon]